MGILIDIILILAALVLVIVLIAGAMYVAIIAYHEARWKQIKGDSYDQFNRD